MVGTSNHSNCPREKRSARSLVKQIARTELTDFPVGLLDLYNGIAPLRRAKLTQAEGPWFDPALGCHESK